MTLPTVISAACLWVALLIPGGDARAQVTLAPVEVRLRALAARAGEAKGRVALRRYAPSARSPKQRGLAYFVLGYREYEAGEYGQAQEDLHRAAATGFSLADFAEYYLAEALHRADQLDLVPTTLQDFSARHPQSPLRLSALELLARALLRVGRPERAIELLTAEPRLRQRPALMILLAQGYADAGREVAAARVYQEIFCAHPTAPEAATARTALEGLRPKLGELFPEMPREVQTARAQILYDRSRFQEALADYEALLQVEPESSHAPRWKLGQAKCLLRLRRAAEVIEALKAEFPKDPAADAERLAALVEAHRRQGDEGDMLRVLAELRRRYPESVAGAGALDEVGEFFTRKGDWAKASEYYQLLAESFPASSPAREASWRAAWARYLRGDLSGAAEAFTSHVTSYPGSPYAPAALFWLGRLAERRGALAEARELYRFLLKRFVHSYYAGRAAVRRRRRPRQKAPAKSLEDSSMAVLAATIPPTPAPPLEPCPLATADNLVRPLLTLQALGLDEVGDRYARAVLAENPAAHALRLALSRLQAQNDQFSPALFNGIRIVPNYPEYEFSQLPRELWEAIYPRAYWSLVSRQARAHGLDPYLVMAVIRQESTFNPRATSPAGARGLMQVLPGTATRSRRRRAAVAERLYDPAYNVRVGCQYLRARLRASDGNPEQALAGYHAGPARVTAWTKNRTFNDPAEFMESIPIPATRLYVERVQRDAAIYRKLLAGTAKFTKCPRR